MQKRVAPRLVFGLLLCGFAAAGCRLNLPPAASAGAPPTKASAGAAPAKLTAAGATTEPEPESDKSPVHLVAVGDLMLGTNVKQVIQSRGATYPFRKYRKLLETADLTFGNLETPLSDRGSPTPGKSAESLRNGTNFIFRASPQCAPGLADVGFDVVSVANNHAMDYGGTAFTDTLDHCKDAGLLTVGGGRNLEEAIEPVFITRNGQRFAMFGISDILPAFSQASEKGPGVMPARGEWFEREMPLRIAEARKQADWVVVSVHWGKELFRGATPKQKRLGHRLIDWGADVVIGHHTHCMGPIEKYKGGLIHYSLGNFIAYTGARTNVEAWEVTFTPGERPTQISHEFNWAGRFLAKR